MSSLSIEEKFEVAAPADVVFEFLTNPEKVVVCLPGAGLDEIENPTTFHGNVKVKVGAVTVAYKGTINMTKRDPEARQVEMVGEGREKGGAGKASMTMFSTVIEEGGLSKVTVNADVKLAGKIVRFGRGMIEAVSGHLFKDFVDNVRAELEPAAGTADAGAQDGAPAADGVPAATATEGGDAPPMAAAQGPRPAASGDKPARRAQKPINGVALLFKVIGNAIAGFFRRLFGGSSAA
jgi:hypothetical protein